MSGSYAEFRREYTSGGLALDDLDPSPIDQFQRWMDQAAAAGLKDPTAMSLGTVDEQGHPWQRLVLLKEVSGDAFVFYTNFSSDKARAIEAEPRVSLLFPWNELNRQVIVAGTAQRMSTAESTEYFHSRPRESQLAAWASRQSRPVESRAELEATMHRLSERFTGSQVPMPDFWGGFRVQPQQIEFWQGGEYRLHDRFRYRLTVEGDWQIQRLQP